MQKANLKKTTRMQIAVVLIVWAVLLSPSLCRAGMLELSDNDLADVYAAGFANFSFENDIARVDFNNLVARTWTEISSLKMGYYNNGTTTGWDNDWTNVSLGSASNDLIFQGLYIEAKFSNTSDPANRKLEYVRIGTNNLSGTISADFNSYSGTIGGAGVTGQRTNLGTAAINSNQTGIYLSLQRSGSQMGYSFHWVSATKTP
jgi:hypothetical protein